MNTPALTLLLAAATVAQAVALPKDDPQPLSPTVEPASKGSQPPDLVPVHSKPKPPPLITPAVKPGEVGRLGLAYVDSGDFDGYRLSVDAKLVRDFYLHGSFADASGALPADDTRAYSLGVSYRMDFGPGKASVGAAIGSLDGDKLNGDQHLLRLAYALRPTKDLEVEFSLTHYLNDLDDVQGVNTDDLTAPALTLRYTFAQGVGIEASFSSENTLLGAEPYSKDGAWSVGMNFSF